MWSPAHNLTGLLPLLQEATHSPLTFLRRLSPVMMGWVRKAEGGPGPTSSQVSLHRSFSQLLPLLRSRVILWSVEMRKTPGSCL